MIMMMQTTINLPFSLFEIDLFFDECYRSLHFLEFNFCVFLVSLVVLGETQVHVEELLIDLLQEVALDDSLAL